MSDDGHRLVAVFLVAGLILAGIFVLHPAFLGISTPDPDDRLTDDSDNNDGLGDEDTFSTPDTPDSDGDERSSKGIYGPDVTVEERVESIGLNHTYSLNESDNPWFEERAQEESLYGDFTLTELDNPGTQEGEHGSGVFVSDHDNDGREDVLALVNFSPVLFENTDDGFEETDKVSLDRNVTSALFFDHDNDGYEDLYLLSDEGSVFLENDGGRFTEKEVGLEVEYDSVRGGSVADYTRNGCLDVLIIQASNWGEHRPEGYDDYVRIDEDNGNENRLFRGDCEKFEEVTDEAGIEGEAWSLATSFVDLTNNGYPDIHVANDFNNDVIYLNNGNGTFERNVLPDFTDRNGMSSEVADVTGNGYLDIFVSNIYHEGTIAVQEDFAGRVQGNNLLMNHGNGTFTDGADRYGVRKGGWGWAAVFEDFNNDGSLELYQSTTDYVRKPSLFWTQADDGFELVTSDSFGWENTEDNAVVAFDYNRNGNLDMVQANAWEENRFYLFENQQDDGNYLRISVEGNESRTGIGAKVRVTARNRTWTDVKTSNTDYLSQSSRTLHFGVGERDLVDKVEVVYPDGTSYVTEEVDTNQGIKLVRGDGFVNVR